MPNSLLNIMYKAFDQMSDIAILFEVIDGRFKFFKANKAAYNAGFTEDRYGKFLEEVLPLQYASNLNRILGQVLHLHESIRYQENLPTTSGKILGDIILTPIFDDKGVCSHILGIGRDITERKKNEEEINRTRVFLESFLASITDGILITDTNFNIIRINKGFTSLFGWEEDEVYKLPFSDLHFIPDGYENEHRDLANELLKGRNIPSYHTIRERKNGSLLDVSTSYSALKGGNGEIIGLIGVYRDISEQIEKERQLEESKQRYQSLFMNHPDAVFLFDLNGHFRLANQRLEKITGYRIEELMERSFIPLVTPDKLAFTIENFNHAMLGETRNYETSIYNKKGERVEVEVTNVPIFVNHTITGVYGIAKNITEQKRIQERYRLIAENMTDLVSLLDSNKRIIYASPSHQNVLGFQPSEGEVFSSELVHQDDLQNLINCYKRVIKNKQQDTVEYRYQHGAGYIIWLETKLTPLLDNTEELNGVLCVSREITERKHQEVELERMAFYDYLTGASNRRLFMDRLFNAIAQAKRNQESFALMFLDFDRFKWVNDTLGHDVGDELLVQFVKRVKNCIREIDLLARLGGDEFSILLPQISSSQDAEEIAKRILATLQEPWNIKGHEFITTSSIGISLYPCSGNDTSSLMKDADQALYKAKQFGGNNYQFYSLHVETFKADSNNSFEKEIRKAIQNNQFYLVYQPKFNLSTGRIESLEALIRWKHPEKGLILPNEFIPLAEELDLIVPITHWVLEQTGKQIMKWESLGFNKVPVSVNISPKHIETGTLINDVLNVIKKTGVEPQYLTLEITENAMVEDIPITKKTIELLREIGVKIAIDDFGKGYSSLSYFINFHVDVIKLDKLFIQELSNPRIASLVHSIVSLAHNLNLRVVAEGIETEEQLKILAQYGCDIGQGYFFSKPLMSNQLEKVFFNNV